MPCRVCCGTKKITLPLYRGGEEPSLAVVEDPSDLPDTFDRKVFDCPECVPMVPYRKVRAMKVTTAYPAEDYGRYQVPIERGLSARFGEYLMREGLIKFTSRGSADMGKVESKITVTAHLGVVSATDVERAGADDEIAQTAAPKIDDARYGKRGKSRARRWVPPVEVNFPDEEITDEFDEPKDALGSRFAGLDFA